MTTPSGRVNSTQPYRTCKTRALTSVNTQIRMTDQLLGIHRIGHAPRPAYHPPMDRRAERLLIVQPQDGADSEAAASELEDLPGVVSVTLNTVTRSFDIIFDSAVVSDDELAAALHHDGYDLISWQEARQLHAAEQRTWLLDQIRSLAARAERELAERGTYADGVSKGAVDAYVRAARAFGLVTDAEIIRLIPARFLEGPG
jgi:copper chaperone CopZ